MANGQYELAVRIIGDLAVSFGTSMSKAEKEINALYNTSRRQNAGLVKGIDQLSGMSDKVFGAVVKGATVAATGIGVVAAASISMGKSFEAQMSTVQAISNASASEMKLLNAAAEEMGRTTKFSATESGQALEYMAMAGWKADQMISGLPGIMNLAAASGEELGMVSDIVTDALTAFGLVAEDSAHFADVLAQASSNSNTNVSMMGETFKYVAPVAGSFGYTIEDTALAIGLLANSGIKSSQAGTSLRKMLLELGGGATLTGKAFGKMKIQTANTDGSMRALKDVMVDLRNGFSQMTQEEKAANAEAIAGKTGIAGLLAIVNAADSDFDKLAASIDNSNGAAQRMANLRIDNFSGDITLLQSAVEGAGIGIYNGLVDPLREVTKLATAWVNSFTESDWLENFTTEGIPTARRNLIQFGQSFEPLIDAGKWFLKNPRVVSSSLAGIGATLLTFKAAKGITTVIKGIGTLSGIMGAWPVMAAGAAIGTIVGIGTAIAQAEKEEARANLADHFGDISLSMKELNEVAKNIVGFDLLNGIDLFQDAQSQTSGFQRGLRENINEINKANWKLKLGVEFTEEDTESYKNNVEQYVKNAQDYITSSGYELKLAIGVVMGDSEAGQESAAGNDAFTQSLLAQIEPIKQNISETLTSITEEGFTLDKQKILDGYLKDMSEITQMITDAENAAKLQLIEGQYKGLGELTPETFQNLQQSIAEYTDTALTGIDESYEKILVGLNARKLAGDLTDVEFGEESTTAMNAYYQRKAEAIQNGQQAMLNAVNSTYGSEITAALEELDTAVNTEMEKMAKQGQAAMPAEEWKIHMDTALANALGSLSASKDTKNAISMLLKGMEPGEEDLRQLAEQYKNSGGKTGDEFYQGLMESMSQTIKLEAATGNEDAIWTMLGTKIADSPELAVAVSAVEQSSFLIPDATISAINKKQPEVEQAAANLLQAAKTEMENGFDATVPIRISMNMATEHVNAAGIKVPAKVNYRAKGGHVMSPELSWIAEAGYPETVIPHDGSQRSIDLWKETGKLIGAYQENNYSKMSNDLSQVAPSTGATSSNSSTEAPVLHITNVIQGNASREDLDSSNQNAFEQFKEWFAQMQHEQARVQF